MTARDLQARDGQPSRANLTQLETPHPALALNATRPAVRELQQKLNAAGASPRLAVDGIFGVATTNAVIAFQQSAGLTADGTGADPITFTVSLPADLTVNQIGVPFPPFGTFDWSLLGWACTGDGPGAAQELADVLGGWRP